MPPPKNSDNSPTRPGPYAPPRINFKKVPKPQDNPFRFGVTVSLAVAITAGVPATHPMANMARALQPRIKRSALPLLKQKLDRLEVQGWLSVGLLRQTAFGRRGFFGAICRQHSRQGVSPHQPKGRWARKWLRHNLLELRKSA